MAPVNRQSGQDKEKKERRRPGRVPTSCAECRRLKLRCDRQVPCETCVKRGCAAICPDGALTTGKGNRLVLANTEELHERIDRLCIRIRELEDALKVLQARVSEEEHPLLQNELLQLKGPASENLEPSPSSGASPQAAVSPQEEQELDEDNLIDAFGTLAIDLNGDTQFLGKTARSDYLMNAPLKQMTKKIHYPRLSARLLAAVSSSVGNQVISADIEQDAYAILPPLPRAVQLCELFLEFGRYMWSAMPREEVDECLMTVYRAGSFDNVNPKQNLSLIFMIFALGALFDPSLPPFPVEAQEYYILSRLTFNPSLDDPSSSAKLPAVQTTAYMAFYLEISDPELKASNQSWTYAGMASRMAHMMGLHLDGARWRLDKAISDRRSRIYWEIFMIETWQSMFFGRPPSISPTYTDCPLPEDVDSYTSATGEVEPGYHQWIYQFTVLLHNVSATAFGAKMPAYSTIIALDRKIREFPVPKYLHPVMDDEASPADIIMKRWLVINCKETVLLNLHRCYFTQTLKDNPEDILKHKYTPSVLAAYRSSWRSIQALKFPSRKFPGITGRISTHWAQALSAAITMCLLVTRAPQSRLTGSALQALDEVLKLFEESSSTCPPAAHYLGTVRRLYRVAHEAAGTSARDPSGDVLDLDRFGGTTQLIAGTSASAEAVNAPRLSPTASTPMVQASHSTSFPSQRLVSSSHTPHWQGQVQPQLGNMHPTILHDMHLKSFEAFSVTELSEIFDFPPNPFSRETAVPRLAYPEPSPEIFGPPPRRFFDIGKRDSADFNCPAPMDPTWLDFMEQLGF